VRSGADRRRRPRGGRRAGDLEGQAPLVLVVGENPSIVHQAEAILCRLKFAVSAITDTNEALRILPDLRPNLVVVSERHELLLRTASPVPVVVMDSNLDTMIDDIRRALRVTPIR
jgi:hypothetical protein